MLLYFTILKHHFIIIPYHFTISPTSQNSIFIKILFFNHSLLLSSNRYIFSDSWYFIIFFIFFSLSLPCSLSLSLCPSISLSLCLTASRVCGSLWCWVWLGCSGFLWIVGLFDGSWIMKFLHLCGGSWVPAVDRGSFFGEF